MPTVILPQRAIIAVTGAQAHQFLQNIVTCDLDGLAPGQAGPGALLTPQGKILFDFLVSQIQDGFRLECRADIADDFLRRLMLYRLRAKVEIIMPEQELVGVSWNHDSDASGGESSRSETDSTGGLRDLRFTATRVLRHYGGESTGDAPLQAWNDLRIAQGIAESGSDYELGEAFPHDVLLDEMGGIGFHKGCYVGQEVVSRMQHRKTARRRVLIVEAESDLPPAGTALVAQERPVGTLGTVSGPQGLAIARIDRVKDAADAGLPILARTVPVTLRIPDWAKFTFPASRAEAKDG